ncbi:hypothetical protein QYM36_000377 [Artemia franciscana]|uniref:Uncharacterized protein n=1 Tax=Artemia franciscana TaxID=6661 RepID=A0AA88ILA5_ARTSF|nr:hypothetical protein QYM36_000377 [Artemia franciscana]
MPVPTKNNELATLIGMLNFLSKNIPNLYSRIQELQGTKNRKSSSGEKNQSSLTHHASSHSQWQFHCLCLYIPKQDWAEVLSTREEVTCNYVWVDHYPYGRKVNAPTSQ